MPGTKTGTQLTQSSPKDRRWPAAFVALAAIWGTSFLFIKVAVGSMHPLHVALGRCAIGLATLLVLLVLSRERLPRGRALWGHFAVMAVLFNTVPFTLFAFGEERVSSVLAGIWNATTPLLTLPVAVLALPGERATRAKIAGLLIGFAGVVVVLGPWRGAGGGALAGSLACLGAAACYGLGFVYTRRFVSGRPESAVVLSAAQLTMATVQLALGSLIFAPTLRETPSPRALLSLLALGALGSGVAYVLNFRVLRAAGATTASTVTYLIPLFSTVAGVVVLGEGVTWNEPLGAVVVLTGVAVSQGLLRPRPARGSS